MGTLLEDMHSREEDMFQSGEDTKHFLAVGIERLVVGIEHLGVGVDKTPLVAHLLIETIRNISIKSCRNLEAFWSWVFQYRGFHF